MEEGHIAFESRGDMTIRWITPFSYFGLRVSFPRSALLQEHLATQTYEMQLAASDLGLEINEVASVTSPKQRGEMLPAGCPLIPRMFAVVVHLARMGHGNAKPGDGDRGRGR